MHLAPLIRDLAIILGAAAIVTFIFQRIRQPVVLGYLLAGTLISPTTLGVFGVSDLPNIKIWAELGVIFLMFNLGLQFSFRHLASLGVGAGITALLEVGLMFILGLGVGRALGWDPTASIFLGCMVGVSSTTIILKTLDDLKLRTRRFADKVLAILIVEDLIAILMLVALSGIAEGRGASGGELITSAIRLGFMVGAWFLFGMFIIPRFVKTVGNLQNDEMLTILSLGLCLALVWLSASFEYSTTLGAFMMGSILAETSEAGRIRDLLRPLRHLFSAIFFVTIGMMIQPQAIADQWGTIALITGVLVIGKIFGISFGGMVTGQPVGDSLQTGFAMAQIGEFSFIIAALGVGAGILSENTNAAIVGVSVLTTFSTPYFVRFSRKVSSVIETKLPVRLQIALTQYGTWIDQRLSMKSGRAIGKLVVRWLASGIVVAVIFVLSSRLLLPYAQSVMDNEWIARAGSWLIAVFVSAPFLWGMIALPRSSRTVEHADALQALPQSNALFAIRFMTVLVVGVLSLEFFEPLVAILLTSIATATLFIVFYRQLAESYHWFERQFLSSFNPVTHGKKKGLPKNLVPWDAHLSRVLVHPNSEVVGRTLQQSKLHEKFGVTVVVIQRGNDAVIAPQAFEVIFPNDQLLLIGTDQQITSASTLLESPNQDAKKPYQNADFDLRRMSIHEKSRFVRQSIRNSKIKEEFGAMVVGVERGALRILNPRSDTLISSGDTLWVVVSNLNSKRLNEVASGPDID